MNMFPKKKAPRYSYEWKTMVLIALLLVVILLASFLQLYRSSIRLANDSGALLQHQLDTMANSLEHAYYNFYSLSEVLAVNSSLNAMASCTEFETATDFVREGATLRKILMSFCSVNTAYINTIAVYFPTNQAVVTMARYISAEENHLFFDNYPEIAPEELERLDFSGYWNGYATINQDRHWIVRKVAAGKSNLAYIMISYNMTELVQSCASVDADPLVLIGSPDVCLYSSGAAIDNGAYQQIWEDAASSGEFDCNGSYIARAFPTNFQDIRCVVGVSSEAQKTIRGLLVAVTLLASLSTLLGLSILLLNLRRNILNPLELLIRSHSEAPVHTGKIVSSLTSTYRELAQDRAQLKKERDYLIPLALGRYLARLNEASSFDKASAIAGSCLSLINLSECGGVAVFAISCIDDKNQYLDSVVSGKTVSISTLHFLLDNVLKDLLFEQYPGIIAPLGKNSFAVIVECEDGDLERIDRQAAQLVSFFHCKVNTGLIVLSATLCGEPSEFAAAVIHIFREISFLAFWETTDHPKDDPGEITSFYQTCLQLRKLIGALTEENVEATFSQMDGLVRGIVHCKDPQNAKYRLYALTTYIVAALNEYRGKAMALEEVGRFEHRLYEARTITDYIEQLHSIILETLQEKDSIDRAVFISGRMNDVREHLQAHFRENTLTVTSVAAQFGISVSYLSRSFKAAYNINLSEYIQRLRVNEAKRLLRTDSVQNVAREVGYWDTQALIRSFKKLEGINPGDYKRLIENEQDWV